MIQFKRGNRKSWLSLTKPLADGQPGYDRVKNKIKIGDGKTLWKDLPYASGLSADEILAPEADAKNKDADEKALITYGTAAPGKRTAGQLYLQYYDAEPETDYIVDYSRSGIWEYQKWKSGMAKCWGTLEVSTTLQDSVGSLYRDNNALKRIKYPFAFVDVPVETATLQSPGGIAWLANKGANTKNQSAMYTIVSTDKQTNSTTYSICMCVSGYWK